MSGGPVRQTSVSQHGARSPEAATALVHLYRGELGRMTSYRRRLDTTTNWAISFVSAVTGLVLSTEMAPHIVILMVLPLLLFFLALEADRFREFEMSRVRVRMLERGYFGELLEGVPSGAWVENLAHELRDPKPTVTVAWAMGYRLRRTYFWIFLVVLITWLLKLEMLSHAVGDPVKLLSLANVGPIPGPVVALVVAFFYVGLVALAVRSSRQSASMVNE